MPYDYEAEKAKLWSDEGQRRFIKVRDVTLAMCATAGACRSGKVLEKGGSGDGWEVFACLDRMVELGELVEVTGPAVAGQDRVFVATQRGI